MAFLQSKVNSYGNFYYLNTQSILSLATIKMYVWVFKWILFMTKLNIFLKQKWGIILELQLIKIESMTKWWLVPDNLESLDLEISNNINYING